MKLQKQKRKDVTKLFTGFKDFSCPAKSKRGYDIAVVDKKRKTYTLYLNYKDCNLYIYNCGSSTMLTRDEFDKILKDYKPDSVYDLEGYDPERWQRYYTTSNADPDLVDLIEIDEGGKEYVLYLDADDRITDGYDEFMLPIYSNYVSRLVFDILKEGIIEKGFLAKEGV